MKNDFLFSVILPLAFFLGVAIPMMYQIWKLRRMISDKMREYTRISYQRDRMERQIYAMNEELTSTDIRFKDANHLFLAEPSSELIALNNSPNYSFFRNLGINIENVNVIKRSAACLMPFNTRYNILYDNIKQICLDNAYECKRSDEEDIPVIDVLPYVVRMILESQVIIAVLDGRNPNVFYEIGIAHASGKMVILLADASKIKDIPFDLSNKRLVLYKDMTELKQKLSSCLNSIKYYD